MLLKLPCLLLILLVTLFCLPGFAVGDARWVAQCRAAQSACTQAHYADAERLFGDALKEARQFGEQSSRVGITLGALAAVYQTEGKYSQAEDLYEQSIKIKEKTLGLEHQDLAVSYNNLASLYEREGKTEKAIGLVKKALVIMEKHKGATSPEVLMLKSNLAQMNATVGVDALSELNRTLAEREKALAPDSPDLAQSLNNLAEWYSAHGQYDEAEPLYKRSLAIVESAMGKENPFSCTVARNLGVLYLHAGKYDLAEPLLSQALHGREKKLGVRHPDYAQSVLDYAALSAHKGATTIRKTVDDMLH